MKYNKICLHCGKEFVTDIRTANFCTDTCNIARQKERRKNNYIKQKKKYSDAIDTIEKQKIIINDISDIGNELKSENEKLQTEIASLKTEIYNLVSKNKNLIGQIASLEKDISKLTKELEDTKKLLPDKLTTCNIATV